MNNIGKHISVLLSVACIALLSTSCLKDFLDRNDAECDYAVQIRYEYNRENTSDANLLAEYVRSLEEYIFDDRGILYAINPLSKDACTGQWVSELDLPPGRYSVIAVGNRSSMSTVTDDGAEPVAGVTHRDDMLLTLRNVSTRADNNGDGNFNNCGRLYHGYRTFSVEPDRVSHVRVDMVHSHHVLKFRIRWKQSAPPMGDYCATMKYVPSEYTLMPEYVYPEQYKCETYDCASHDLFALRPTWVKHHIPTVKQDCNILTHKLHLNRNVDGEIKGTFVYYRIKNETTPTLVLYSGTSATTGQQMFKEINLQRYFAAQKIDLDRTLKQEYAIEIMVDDVADQVLVFPITVADWEEGGSL